MNGKIVCTLSVNGNCIYDNARASFREAARRWGANYLEILVPRGKPGVHHYYQKLLLPEHLPDSCRILYLDGDSIVRSDCPSPFEMVPDGMLGWTRSHHPSHAGATAHILQPMAEFTRRHGVKIDVEEEYLHSGLMLFETPTHRSLFAEAQRMVDEQGFDAHWPIADQGPLTVARKRLGLDVFWLPPMFQMAGSELWSGWSPEMAFPIEHFCGPISRNIAIPRTVWDDLGPDRNVTGTDFPRWSRGKPKSLSDGPELVFLVRELSKLRRARIVEVGVYLGGATWWGAQVARDNFGEYICVDHWQGALDLPADEIVYRGFMENMRDSGLDGFISIIKRSSEEAAISIPDKSLDLVFLNGDHTAGGCLADIYTWYPKLKEGGVMLGHDYTTLHGFGVVEAVSLAFGGRTT